MKTIIWHNFITRQLIREHPDDVWLFDDNVHHKGMMGGMALWWRGEPNCVGIPTKIYPHMDENAFWHDVDYDWAIKIIDGLLAVAMLLAKDLGGNIIIPYGLGRGLAELPKKSPKIWNHLQERLQELMAMNVSVPLDEQIGHEKRIGT